MEMQNKIVVITGGASGIGFAIAKALSANNTVVSLDRNPQSISQLSEKLPNVVSIQTDVTNIEQVEAALKQIETKFDKIDLLINNAGIGKAVDFDKLTQQQITEIAEMEMKVNYFAPISLTKLAMPLLNKSNEPAVAFTTSGLAYVPSATHPTHSATKAALHSFVLTLRHQLRNTKIKVIELLPPTVDTAFTKEIKAPKIKPEQVALEFLKGLKSGNQTIKVGQTGALSIISRITPSGAFKMLNPSSQAL